MVSAMNVMICGMPGKMAQAVAGVCARRGINVIPYSLTIENVEKRENEIQEVLKEYPNLIAVDYTHPSAVNGNAEFYVKHKIPFVMGTTGGDRDALMSLVKNANHPCVIAPNMAKQIVALQAMLEWTAKNFANVFEGYSLRIVESHQKTKADTSGTAKALLKSFTEMGASNKNGIEMIRDKDHGHAYHTYYLDSPDKSVHFEFCHNVNGREIYAEGTADAVEFLAKKIETGNAKVFNMIDVLSG
jgi:4-hydroxy-tetrahydrodipicolinate reductase